jgi:hypothetical protein
MARKKTKATTEAKTTPPRNTRGKGRKASVAVLKNEPAAKVAKKGNKITYDPSAYEREPQFVSGQLDAQGKPRQGVDNVSSYSKDMPSGGSKKPETGRVIGTITHEVLYQVFHRSLPKEPGYSWPFTQMLRENDDLREKLAVHVIANLRHPEDPNLPWQQTKIKKNGEPFTMYWTVYVKIFKKPKENASENRIKWGEKLTRCLNKLGKEKIFPYRSSFAFAGDITPDQNDLAFLGQYLTTADVMNVIQLSHPKMTQEQILEDENLLNAYYGPDRVDQVRRWFGPPDFNQPSDGERDLEAKSSEQLAKDLLEDDASSGSDSASDGSDSESEEEG